MLTIGGICVEPPTKQFHECSSWNRREMARDVWVAEERFVSTLADDGQHKGLRKDLTNNS